MSHIQMWGSPVLSRPKTTFFYALVIVASVLLYGLVWYVGASMYGPPQFLDPTASKPVVHFGLLAQLLLAITIVIITAKAIGFLFRHVGQPAVIGEVIAGIFLGPSVLGQFAPEISVALLPADVVNLLGMMAQVGVIIFMFLVGMELDTRVFKKKGHTALAISHASIVTPFLLGAVLAIWTYPRFSTPQTSFLVFSLFTGVALSVTAFPVLARILKDLNVHKSPMGALALSCAAVDDVTAWCLLALLISIQKAHLMSAATTFVLTIVFCFGMIYLVRPFILKLVAYTEKNGFNQGILAIVTVAILISALITESIGIHALFGAFLLGTLFPSDTSLASEVSTRVENLVVILLLPAFFAFTGMRTEIALLNSLDHWLWCLAIIIVAAVGKIGGTYVAGRITGVKSSDALALGTLMNSRGLMELIVLNIGLDLGILTPALFAMMVIMAIATTLMTAPLFKYVTRQSSWTGTTDPT